MHWRTGIGGLCLLCGFLLVGCGPARPNAKDVKRDLAKAIPLQSTSAQVLEYLSGRKIEHSEYVRDGGQGNWIRTSIRDRRKLEFVTTDCLIVFRFDDHDRLASYDVREVYTGP